ncbi:MAG: universal stress protein [Pirellulaceae bacterium]
MTSISFQNQTLIVPFDFSKAAENALNQVLKWADESNQIHLVYVAVPSTTIVDLNPPYWMPPNLDSVTREKVLEELKERFGKEPYSRVNLHCLVGDPGAEITKLAESESANAIVMPSHGRSGVSRMLLGSVAERVLRMAHCPVLVLKEGENEKQS